MNHGVIKQYRTRVAAEAELAHYKQIGETREIRRYYGVTVGRVPGVYDTLDEAQAQTLSFSKGHYKGFNEYSYAKAYYNASLPPKPLREKPLPKLSSDPESVVPRPSNYTPKTYKGNYPSNEPRCKHTLRCLKGKSDQEVYKNGNRFIVHTDGACSNNQSAGQAVAGIGVYFGSQNPENFSGPLLGGQTNQRAELAAILKAVGIIEQRPFEYNYALRTDSKYAIDVILRRCKAKENVDIISPIQKKLRLLRTKYNVDIRLEHVSAHSGIEGNERADHLAREGVPIVPRVIPPNAEVIDPWGKPGPNEYPTPLHLKDKNIPFSDLYEVSYRLDDYGEPRATKTLFAYIGAAFNQQDKQASFGVYFGPNNPDNYFGALQGKNQTKERAELAAYIYAMRLIGQRSFKYDYEIGYTSLYLEKVMDMWIGNSYAPALNSHTTALMENDKLVKNADLIEPSRRIQRESIGTGCQIRTLNVPYSDRVKETSKLAGHVLPFYHKKTWGCV